MIQLITGSNGTGKTKQLVENMISAAANSKGNIIYIDNGSKLALSIPSSIRFIDTEDYNVSGCTAFFGFVSGLCAGNYDLTDIFVDSTLQIISDEDADMQAFFDQIAELSQATGVNFHFSVCCTEDRQSTLCKYAS